MLPPSPDRVLARRPAWSARTWGWPAISGWSAARANSVTPVVALSGGRDLQAEEPSAGQGSSARAEHLAGAHFKCALRSHLLYFRNIRNVKRLLSRGGREADATPPAPRRIPTGRRPHS